MACLERNHINYASGSTAGQAIVRNGSGLLALTLLLFAGACTAATKAPNLIRAHLLDNPDESVTAVKSVEPHQGEALDALVTTRIWQVAYNSERSAGEMMVFMAVHEGEALRIFRFDLPRKRDNFVKLLPADFRLQSRADAERIVAATLDLHFGSPFSEPEKTVEEMHFERRGNDYYFVDGERFGDGTGYRITVDDDGRVTGYEYSWDLPVKPPQE